jgi:adenylylsulfate reductase subunit A
MEKETCTFSYCEKPEIVEHETDMLLIGGGMACCGSAYEGVRWAAQKGLKVTMVDKAAADRSGAVAMGLSAINTYIGENKCEDYVRYVRNDLMGITREDLVYDLGRHVDDSVHLFEEWGLPIWKKGDDGFSLDGHQARDAGKGSLVDGATPVRSGKWQIMINGESYKAIVAEAAKKALEENRVATGVDQNLFERVFIVRLFKDANDPNRVAAAVGLSVRENKMYIFKAKGMVLAAGGAVNCFRPRSTAEGQGRAWYPIWNSGSGYALGMQAGAELTLMENRMVPARFKDGYGPVGAWFLFFKAKATNSLGEDYCANEKYLADAREKYGAKYVDKLGTTIRNHLMLNAMKEGKGPIIMRTDEAMDAINKNFIEKLGEKEGKKKVKKKARRKSNTSKQRHGKTSSTCVSVRPDSGQARTLSLIRYTRRSCLQSRISSVHTQAVQDSGAAAPATYRARRITTPGVTTGCQQYRASSWPVTSAALQDTSSPQVHTLKEGSRQRLA